MPLTVKGRQFCLFPQKIVILSLLLLQEGRCRRRSALQRGSDAYAPGPCGQIGAFAARRSSLGSYAADLRQFLRPRRALQHPVAATKIGHGMFRLRQLPMYPINLGAQGLDQLALLFASLHEARLLQRRDVMIRSVERGVGKEGERTLKLSWATEDSKKQKNKY